MQGTQNRRGNSIDRVHADVIDLEIGIVVAGAAWANNVVGVLCICDVSPPFAGNAKKLTQTPVVPPLQVAL